MWNRSSHVVHFSSSPHLLSASMDPTSFLLSLPGSQLRSRTKRGSAIEARLQTAVSSGEVYSMISVHRLEHLMVPRF